MPRHTLPDLPYRYDALEPHIDAHTMEVHHARHHRAHVNRLNDALAQLDPSLQELTVEDLVRNIDLVPEDARSAIRNHGGGHANHSLFWNSLSPAGGEAPSGALGAAIDETFGSFEVFKDRFSLIAGNQFGSGWVWLIRTRGKLVVYTLPNQDSPLLVGERPLLGLDLWEHAYCGRHEWRRDEYIEAFWNVVNWDEVGRRYDSAQEPAGCRRQPQHA